MLSWLVDHGLGRTEAVVGRGRHDQLGGARPALVRDPARHAAVVVSLAFLLRTGEAFPG